MNWIIENFLRCLGETWEFERHLECIAQLDSENWCTVVYSPLGIKLCNNENKDSPLTLPLPEELENSFF